jgi:uncharacterized protein (DUF302 family)
MNQEIGFETQLLIPFEQAIARTIDALKNEGFGVLTRIDVQSTLKEKINVEFQPYIILGACNPPLAHRALSTNLDVGLFLPCNVTVYQDGGQVVVKAVNPVAMLGPLGSDPSLHDVADEAGKKLRRAIASLGS